MRIFGINLISFLPITFVVIWSSAFISAKAIIADATPFAALSLRFAIVASSFALFYLILQTRRRASPWLSVKQIGHAAIIGLLFHGFYLGGVFWALSHGLSATLSALIASLQPIFVALLAGPLLAEQISQRQWVGIVMGFLGAVMVIGFDIGGAIPIGALLICIGALCSSIIGTFYQKHFGQNLPLIPSNIIQAFAATLLHLLLISLLETPSIAFTTNFITAMAWQVLAVSFGAYVMLMVLLKRGTANQTSSLLFLVAPVAAIQAWLVLGEVMSAIDIAGLCLASCGVYMATRQAAANKS